MGLLLLIACGALLGWFAQRTLPALVRMSARAAVFLGAAGALIGGFLACALSRRSICDVHIVALAGGAIGTYAVLLVSSRVFARRVAT